MQHFRNGIFFISSIFDHRVIIQGTAGKACIAAAGRGHLQLTLSIFTIILRRQHNAHQSQSSHAPVGARAIIIGLPPSPAPNAYFMKPASSHPGIPDSSGRSNLRVYLLLITLIALVVIFYRMPRPCQEPLTYRIGTVDARFGLSRPDFAGAAGKAASIWGKPYARALFREEPNGKIEVNLVYDYRQEAADKLKKLHYAIGTTKGTYDDMKVRFENLKAEYESKSAAFATDSDAYNRRLGAYNAEVEAGRQRGAVTEAVYRRLTAETGELNTMREN